MTGWRKRQVQDMAREAGFPCIGDRPIIACGQEELEAFEELVRADEREVCAKVCEELEDDGGEWDIQQQCANAIRARGQA